MIQVAGIYENGQVRLLSPIPKKKAKVIVIVLEESETSESKPEQSEKPKRILGLNRGEYFMSDDFDAPLPDSFWLGEE
jgi:hypothetical protein